MIQLLSLLLCAGTALAGSGAVISGIPWFDDGGNRIEAHGGGFLQAEGKYFWYGETKKTNSLADHGVNCYSSTDLVTWHFEGQVLYQQNLTGLTPAGPYVVERPKVVFNTKSGEYVMWFHLDSSDYKMRQVGVATSTSPSKGFTFVKGFQPDGVPSLDMSLYQDEDGTVYHVRSANNEYVAISALSPDFMNTTGIVSKIAEPREGPALFKFGENYYLVTSHLSGWAANPMELFFGGTSISGAEWKSLGNPTGSKDTFDSQSTNVLLYPSSNGQTTVIYQGDRWNYFGPGGLLNATYIWLPMQFVESNASFVIPWQSSWTLPSTQQ